MKSNRVQFLTAIATLIAASSLSRANIVSVTSDGQIIPPPAKVKNAQVTNDHQQGFNERQDFLLASPLPVDGGSIPAGTEIDSHMIFLNQAKEGGATSFIDRNGDLKIVDTGVIWTFAGEILGVMSDVNGGLEKNSAFLGAPGTTYPDYLNDNLNHRGMEDNDDYLINGKQLTVNMHVTQPGDWIRVITRAPDAGASASLLGLGLAGIALFRRKVQN